jgi:hypothetical protein
MHMRAPRPGVGGVAAALALVLAACSPVFDWRESRPEGSDAALMFPCRPERHQRPVRLGAATLPMRLHACSAGDAVFSLSVLDVADPVQVTPLLAADAAFFVKGLRLYQATILGSDKAPGREAVDTFFGAIRLP